MRNHRILAAAALAATAAAAAAALDAAGQQPAPTAGAPRTLTLTAPFVGGKGHFIDHGKKGIGPGDVFVSFDVPVRDAQTGRRVGTSDGMETILARAHNGTVSSPGALRLADGRIEVAGTLRHTDPVQSWAVIGGTGAYAGARGEVTIREDTKRKLNVVRVTLLP